MQTILDDSHSLGNISRLSTQQLNEILKDEISEELAAELINSLLQLSILAYELTKKLK